ncbi:umecyanin-like [Mangifera indica]|uniref:umecyanin-like n=1 Tax=Mangifera indica TaxID=29780 RepID=UPI001CFAAD3E|nr:umecyanin-like [Mangifera indica]
MARISMAQAVTALVLSAATLLHVTYAVNYTVGDTTGWTRPSDSTFYTTWAANKTFRIGDFLVFNFATGSHAVAIVTLDAYNSCNVSNTIQVLQTGPVTLSLNTTGEHYYMCTFPGHCNGGQKLAINVVAATNNTAPAPSGTSVPPGTTVPSVTAVPPGTTTHTSAASPSRGLTFALLMLIAIGLFC